MKSWQIAVIVGVVLILGAGGAFMVLNGSEKAAATVNGVSIPESEVAAQLDIIKKQQAQLFKGPGGKEQEKQFRDQVVSFLVNAELIQQEAKRLGITVPEKDLDKRFNKVKKLFPDKKQFAKALGDQGLTEDGLREKIREQVITDKMMARVTKGIKAGEADKKKYYEKNKEQFKVPEQRQLRQIATKSKKDADAVLEELEGGADFAEVAKKKSADERTAKDGGDIGFVGMADLPPKIAEAIKGADVNENTGVVDAGDGRFYIFRVEGVKAAKQQTYEEVSAQIEQKLVQEAQQTKFAELIQRLTKEAKITKT